MNAHILKTTAYWALAGAMIGVGVITTFSTGIPLILIGVFFMSYGLANMERQGLWAALVSVVVAPSSLLFYGSFTVSNNGVPPAENSLQLVLLACIIAATAFMTLTVFRNRQASKVSR